VKSALSKFYSYHGILSVAVMLAVLASCGDDADDDSPDGSVPDAEVAITDAAGDAVSDAVDNDASASDAGALTLTSTVLTEGGVIPDVYSCHGDNISPPLAWSGGAAAPAYAVVFEDLSNPLIHSIIYDIPGDVDSLPEGVENVAEPSVPAGAKQTLGYDESTRGYLGPCPGSTHTYRFRLHAVDAAQLPGVTLDSSREEVAAAIEEHSIETADLTATFTP